MGYQPCRGEAPRFQVRQRGVGFVFRCGSALSGTAGRVAPLFGSVFLPLAVARWEGGSEHKPPLTFRRGSCSWPCASVGRSLRMLKILAQWSPLPMLACSRGPILHLHGLVKRTTAAHSLSRPGCRSSCAIPSPLGPPSAISEHYAFPARQPSKGRPALNTIILSQFGPFVKTYVPRFSLC
jgi:hypothetical protein